MLVSRFIRGNDTAKKVRLLTACKLSEPLSWHICIVRLVVKPFATHRTNQAQLAISVNVTEVAAKEADPTFVEMMHTHKRVHVSLKARYFV